MFFTFILYFIDILISIDNDILELKILPFYSVISVIFPYKIGAFLHPPLGSLRKNPHGGHRSLTPGPTC